MLHVTDDYAVLTPEKVIVTYPLASLGSRIAAHLIDLFVVAGLWFSIAIALSMSAVALPSLSNLILGLVTTFGIFLYFILFEGLWQGQTLGKRILGIRVTMADGTPTTIFAAFYRNLLRPADMLPGIYGIGMIAIFMNPRAQRLGDLVANTVVVRTSVPNPSFTPAPHRVGLHPLEHTIGDLSKMTIAEYYAIKRLCDRFPALPPTTQQESLQKIWTTFAQRHDVKSEPNVHPIYQMEAVVMKYGRMHKLV